MRPWRACDIHAPVTDYANWKKHEPMPLFMIILVSLVQGITEFLPISSSGHLVLLPILTDQPYQGRTIDVAAHVGTLIAVIIFMRTEIIAIIIGILSFGTRNQADAQLGMMLVAATIPVVGAGLYVNYADWGWLTMIETLAWSNLIFAVLLWATDHYCATLKNIRAMRFSSAIFIGVAQICALVPGASRSGVTMTAARMLGFERIAAARFSLLLSLPTIAGAGILKTRDLINDGDLALGNDAALVVLFSCILALIAMRVMMVWLTRANFNIFVYYRLALGVVLLWAIQHGLIAQII